MSGLSPVWRVSRLLCQCTAVAVDVKAVLEGQSLLFLASISSKTISQSGVIQSLGTGKRTRQCPENNAAALLDNDLRPPSLPPQQPLKQQDKATSPLVCIKFRIVQGGDSAAASRGPHSLSLLRSLRAPLLLLASISSKTT